MSTISVIVAAYNAEKWAIKLFVKALIILVISLKVSLNILKVIS